jgi:two-component system sensor histidine kinase/response regulator
MKTVLLIDDDKNVRLALGMALQHCGYRVIEAASGAIGLEMARQQLPDLILTDITMPDMDGQAVLKHIRQDPVLSNKQVVLMTGNPGKVSPRNGMEAGADDFLVKPVGLADLSRCVEARMKRAQLHWRVEDRMLSELRSTLHSHLPHEFFTPLAGIIGLADLLRSELTSFSCEDVEDLLNDIHASGLRLHRTLKNYLLMLDLQAISNEGDARAREFLSPQVLKESLLAGIEAAVHRHKRQVDVVEQIEECSVLANAGDVSTIVEELVDNACNYSRPGTPITIHFNTEGILTVSDAGRGMAPEEIRQIGAFQQFDSKKHAQQGLGLGLVITQKLAEKCMAKLSIESVLSQGTQVKIAFKTDASPASSEKG